MTTEQALKALQDAFQTLPTAPEGWFTLRTLAQVSGIPEGSIGRKAAAAAKAGRLVRNRYHLPNYGPVWLYQFTDPRVQKQVLTAARKCG